MKRLYAIYLMFFISVLNAFAQNYTLKGKVDEVVHVGENFYLRYTANSRDASNFVLGKLPDALEKVFGPGRSVSVSSSTINGHTTSSEELTLTYILSASRPGRFTIPPAHITVDGKEIKSQELTVEVIESQSQQRPSARENVSGADFFVIVSASKRHVKEYEPFLLTYKICWHPDLPVINLDNINLELQNVFMEAYDNTPQKSVKLEQINGQRMMTIDWQQYLIYPQKAGTLTIPEVEFNGYIKQDMTINPFDPFSSSYREVTRKLKSQSLNIQVDALPEHPVDYSGGVGSFTVSAELDKSEVKENTPITLKVKVHGTGNMNMLREPTVTFPSSFDTYDTKSTDNYHTTASGISGDVTYEFIAVPQRKGSYTIAPASLTYYDLQSNDYKTVKTDSFHITVLQGENTSGSVHDFTGQEDVENLASDIRHIKQGGTSLRKRGETFFASSTYIISLLVLLLIFVSLFIIFRQRAIDNADIVKSRGKNANKVATKRLRVASRLMHDGKQSDFYDETLRALWGYVSDKLNMPSSQLSQENISERLQSRNVAPETTAKFLEAIDECEFERYAPGDPKGNMNKVYEKAMTAIEEIERDMKRKVKHVNTPVVALCLLFATFTTASAATKADADASYNAGDYALAVQQYEQILSQGVSSDVYYNLGNAYYRLNDMTRAVLSYERALKLSPGDGDIVFNLQMARSKTVDKISPETEMFFVTWYRSLLRLMSTDGWAVFALVALTLAIILTLIYLFATPLWLRKLGFFGGATMLLLFLLGNLFAWQQKRTLLERNEAIVIESPVSVKSTPTENGTSLFILHGGTKVYIVDDTMDNWKEVRVADGRQGWVETSDIEKI